MLPPVIKKAIIALHVTAAINALAALLFFIFIIVFIFIGVSDFVPDGDMLTSIVGLVYLMMIDGILLGMAIFTEIVIHQLKQGRYWAWIAGMIISGINLPSLYFVLGLFGILGLANKTVAKYYIDRA